MSIIDLFSRLKQLGVQLGLDGDKLKIKAPPGVLNDELKEQLKLNKDEIIAFLKGATATVENNTFPVVDRAGTLPLSYMQQGMWFVEQLNPGTPAYTMPFAYKIMGDLDVELLGRAVKKVMARQEILKSRFVSDDNGSPLLILDDNLPTPYSVQDVHLKSGELNDALKDFARKETLHAYDLEKGPLFKVDVKLLFVEGPEKGDASTKSYLLSGSMHHIISDGWSQSILIRELLAAYIELRLSMSVPLPPLNVQYVDFSAWQQQRLATSDYQQKLSYWKEKLRGVPVAPTLPTDFPRPAIQTSNGRKYDFSLSGAIKQRFEAFCKEQDITLFMGLYAAWLVVISRYSQTNDFCIGIPTAGRANRELEALIGYFVNPIILRSGIKDEFTLQDLVKTTKRNVLDAFDRQEVPFAQILDSVSVHRSLAYSPVVQIGFQLQNFAGVMQQSESEKQLYAQIQQLASIAIEPVNVEEAASKFDLIVTLTSSDTAILGQFEYNSDLFRESTMASLARYFESIVGLMLDELTIPLREIQLGTLEEVAGLLGLDSDCRLRKLTDTQRLLYLDAAMNTETVQNSIGVLIDLPFPVQLEKLKAAIDHIVSTYSIYRTTFVTCDIPWAESVYQVVHPRVDVTLTIEDATHLTDAALDMQMKAWVYTPYDIHSNSLCENSLYAFKLYKRADEQWRLVMKSHHIVVDGTSLVFWVDKLGQSYDALMAGNPLPQWEDRYEEFIDIRRREVDKPETLEYWKNRFRDCVPLTISKIPGATRTADFEVLNHEIDAEHARKIQQFCKKNRTHPVDYFRLLTELMIRHYCRPEGNFIFNEVQNGRANTKDDTLGVFYQAVPWVVDLQTLQPTTTLRQCYDGMSAYRKEIRNHRQYSVLAQLHATEQPSIFFQFNYFNFLAEHVWQNVPIYAELQSAHVERTVQCFFKELPETYLMQLWCDRTTFDDHRYLERVAHLSRQIVDGGVQTLGELSFVLPNEQGQLAKISNVAHPLAPVETVVEWFEQSVLLHSHIIAIKHGDHALTYGEINAKANRLARALHDQGIGAGARVAILLSRRVEMLVAVLAVLKANAAYVPVEASYPCDRIQYIIRDSGAKAVITEDCQLSKIGETQAWLFDVDADAPQLAQYATENLTAHPHGDDEIYVIYTSGSTGQPKGASVHHRGEVNLQQWYIDALKLNANDVTLIISAFGFDLTQKNLYALLLVGGTIVLPEMDEYDDSIVRDAIQENKVTIINCAPSAFYPLVGVAEYYRAVNSVRWVVLGGEPIRLPLLYPWLSSFGCIARLVNSYGPTECTDVVSYHILDDIQSEQMVIPIGLPVPNCKLHIVDHALVPVAPGLIGELCVTGICVGNGYVGRQDLTDQAFVVNPFGTGKLYKTGDLCRQLPSGEIEYIGRKDFQVKIRGLRIELGEIEKALTEQAEINDGLVLVRDEKLTAYIVAPDTCDFAALREHLRARLPEYMVPSFIVRLDQWPLTPNGKVDRKALPLPNQASVGSTYVAPRNETERRLVQIWEEVLKLDKIGVVDNFFELGGHSLLATQIVSRTRKTFDVALSLRDLLTDPTIAALAERIVGAAPGGGVLSISHADRTQRLPLSYAQQRLWLLDRLEPGNVAYNVPIAVRIDGQLNASVLQRAISDVINRHEGFRTCFREDEQGPNQILLPVQQWPTETVTLVFSTDDHEFEIQRVVGQKIAYSFDLSEGPLFQSSLIALSESSWIYVFVAHHIVTDGWSMGVFIKEVLASYLAYTRGLPLPLPPVSLQYADFAAWQRQQLDGDALLQKLGYWKQALEDLPVLALPTDFPRPSVQTYNGATVRFRFDKALTSHIDALARSESVTPFAVLMSLLSALLARYSNQSDFAIGTPVAGRDTLELENIIGFFVNTVALRVKPEAQLNLRQLMKQVADTAGQAFEHQEIPFEQIVDAVDPARDMSRSPLFQVMLVLQNLPLDASVLDDVVKHVTDVAISSVPSPVDSAKFDITLTFAVESDQYEASLQYNTDLFEDTTIQTMITHLQRIASLWLERPDATLKDLDILTPAEKDSLVHRWNATSYDFDRTATIQSLFARSVDLFAENVAVRCGQQSYTYRDLDRHSTQLAGALVDAGVKPGDNVGVCFDRSLNLMTALLGVVKCGATYVPIDASYPVGRITYMVDKAGITHVVTRQALTANLPEHLIHHDVDAIVREMRPLNSIQLSMGKPDDLFYVIFTSGSTGNPKGAAVYQRSEINLLHWYAREFSMSPQDCVLLMSAIGFDLTQKNLWAPLLQGACLEIPDFQEYDAVAFSRLIAERDVTWVNCAPSAFYPLVDADTVQHGYPTLRWVFLGGEPINFSRLAPWYRHTSTALVNSYGPTECTDISSYHVISHDHPVHSRVPIGKPNYNVQLYVLGQHLELLPPGATGELYVAGEGVGAGYLGDSEQTARVFVDHPFAGAQNIATGKLYKTGDLVRYLPNGDIDYLGRIDHQIKLRGYRIEIDEIQAVINSVEGVVDSYVAIQGDGASQMLAAWLVRDTGHDSSKVQQLAEAKVSLHLPLFMRPHAYVVLDCFPLTPNGKIDRKALPTALVVGEETLVEPQTALQKEMSNVWCQALGINKLGLASNFFALGGNSLVATQIISKLNKRYNVQTSVRSLFDNPRFEDFCHVFETIERGVALPTIKAGSLHGEHPLSYGQSRLWYFEQLNPGTCVNNMPGALLIKGDFNVQGLRFALNETLARHSILRAIFYLDGESGPKLRIQDQCPESFRSLDVSQSLTSSINDYIEATLDQEANTPFNLAKGPLLRVSVVKLPEWLDASTGKHVQQHASVQQHALVFCMHHIASDGLSMSLLLRELMTHYASFVTRKPLLLPSLKVQYTDYAQWQRDWLASADLDIQLQFWDRTLANAPDFNTFPTDFERPSVQTTRGQVLQFVLDEPLVKAIEHLGKAKNITPFVITLAAWKMLLCRYNQREDIVVGVPTAGRSHPELDALIGFFINSVIIRSQWAHNATLRDIVEQVKEATLSAFANSNVPLDMIVQRLPIKRSTSHTPLVQVAFQLVSESENQSFDALNSFTGLQVEMFEANRATANFDVTLSLQHSSGNIKAALEYNVDLYQRGTMESLWQQYVTLLHAIVETPELPLQALQLDPDHRLLQRLGLSSDEYERVIPLTHMQRDMFIDNIVNPHSLQSSHGWVIHLKQPLDLACWKSAVEQYFNYYPIARARYVTSDCPALDVGYLAIPRHTNIAVEYEDKSVQIQGKQMVEEWLAPFIYRTYNLREDDLVRFKVVKSAEDHYAVSVSTHHAIFDGVALTTLWQQLAACYNALKANEPFEFASDIYHEHVDEDRATKDSANVLQFWKHTLATVEPLDFTVPPPIPSAGKARLIENFISEDHWNNIRQYCRKQKITPAIYFKGLYALLIDLYCRPDSDFSLQETMSGRTQSHAMQPGCYIQEVPFVVPKAVLQASESLQTLWEHAREYQKSIKDYRLISLGAQARLSPRGRIGFMYNFYQFVPQTLELAGEVIEDPQGTPSDPANNVQFVVSFVGGKLRLSLYYHPHLFDDRKMLSRLESVSRQIIEGGVDKVGELRWVIDAAESQLLLKTWNDTKTPFDLSMPMHVRFLQQVQQHPTALAIVDDQRALSYADLDSFSNQLSHYLIALGVNPGELVGLCVERSCEFLIGILAILKAGAAYVPMDAHYPQDRITYMRENSQAKVIVSQRALSEKLGRAETFKAVFVDADWGAIEKQPSTTPDINVQPLDVAYMLYTSGSTGLPKGALIRHDGALNHIEAERKVLQFPGAFNFLQTAPASSDISVWQFLGPVTCGGSVVVLDEVTQADKMFNLVNRYQVNVVELVPVAWQLLIEHVKSLPEQQRAMPSLKWLMATGEAVPVPMVNEWLALFPDIPVVNAYGPTEAADDVIQNTLTQPLPADVRSVPIGKPLANMNVFIVDEHMRLVPPGIPGEICLSGIGVGNGYWQNPEKTESAFVPNPFPDTQGNTIYKTGDLGRWLKDGTVEYLDRVDNQVKIRGFRIELGEVEAVLAAQPGVAESAVIVRKDLPGGPALVGYIVLHDMVPNGSASAPLIAAIKAGMRDRLPEYMVPAAIVVLSSFPTTPAGKIDKKNLPAPTEQSDEHYVAPRTELESLLANAYGAVLGREQISIDREFFDLGGNSLMAVRLVSRLAQSFDLQLSVAQLLRTSSVQALAQWIESADRSESHGPLVEIQPTHTNTPSLLFVHPVGGDVLCYQDLRSQWDVSTGIYGVRSPGLEQNEQPVQELSALISQYVSAIEASGVRDWFVIGQSLGGVLSLALAEALQQRGHRVRGVTMVDSFYPAAMKTRPDRLLPDALGLQLPQAMLESVDFSTDGWIDNVYNYALALKLVPTDLTLDRIKRIYGVARANERLVRQVVVPKQTTFPLLHVAARDNSERSPQTWHDTGLAMEFAEHNGDHESVMRGEHARGLAELIKHFMQKALQQ